MSERRREEEASWRGEVGRGRQASDGKCREEGADDLSEAAVGLKVRAEKGRMMMMLVY